MIAADLPSSKSIDDAARRAILAQPLNNMAKVDRSGAADDKPQQESNLAKEVQP